MLDLLGGFACGLFALHGIRQCGIDRFAFHKGRWRIDTRMDGFLCRVLHSAFGLEVATGSYLLDEW